MSEATITYLTQLFQADLDAKTGTTVQVMAAEWLKVEEKLRSEIELMATELAAPPGQLKLDPVTEMVVKMKDAGYDTAKIQKLLASQGIFKIPDVPKPEAKELKDWQLAKLQRYVRLLAQVQNEIATFNGSTAAPVIQQLMADSALAGLYNSLALIDATISAGGGEVISATFDRLNIEAVQNIIAISSAGQPLGDLLQSAYPLAAAGITDRLVYGTAVGWNPRKTARAIIKDGLAQGLNHILLVARDQQVRAVREAGRQSYLKNGIILYKRLAAKQSRTCLACLALDGSIQYTDELMPLHPQDRCSVTPIIPGLDPIPTESGEAWFKRQSPETQKAMMGPGRFAAWKAGKFSFNQLVTVKPNATWGPNAQVTSLKDLLDGKGGFTLSATFPPKPPPKPSLPSLAQTPPSTLLALNHTTLEQLDLHQVAPNWGEQADWKEQSYGGVLFDDQGRLLLRKPTGNFDGYAWTFPKGRMDSAGEHPLQTALREVEQESGYTGAVIGFVPGQFQAGRGATTNNFFLMKASGFDKAKMDLETEDLIWATPDEAEALIKQGTNKGGVARDLAILKAARDEHEALSSYQGQTALPAGKSPVVITNIPQTLVSALKVNASTPQKSVWTNIEQNGKGMLVMDGKLVKAAISYDDTEDKYLHVTAGWADNATGGKTALINAGKLAAKQGKGLLVEINPSIYKAAQSLGLEPGGGNSPHPPGTVYLAPEWIKDWAKAPTKFKAPALAPPPPPPPEYDRKTITAEFAYPHKESIKVNITDPLAQKGATAAIDKVIGGQQGFAYFDKAGIGRLKGVISYEEQPGIIKVGSAGFADFDTNLAALKDMVKIAKKAGKDVVSFAPNGPILEQYKKWGFQTNSNYPNGESLILPAGSFDAWLKDPEAYGKATGATVKATPSSSKPGKGASTMPPVQPQPNKPAPYKANPKARPAEPLPDSIPLPEPADFPDDPASLTLVRRLGGSTGAELVQAADGKLYVRKRGNSPEHILEEAYADAAYLAAGASVPRFRLYQTAGGPVKLAEFIEGETLGEVLKRGGKKAEAARKAAQEGFAADALFSNRDVVGLDYDNILVDKQGRVWRIDNGGSFRFRAQGARKGDWDEYATDLWTLRDKGVNPQTGDVFDGLDFYVISDQVMELQQRREAILAAAPPEVQDVLARRLAHLRDMALTGQDLRADNYRVEYADLFSRDRLELRRAGVKDRMSLGLDAPEASSGRNTRRRQYDVIPRDENGKAFDNLRGSGSVVKDVKDFIQRIGGDFSIIERWGAQQGADSWKSEPVAYKYWLANNAAGGDPEKDYFWRFGYGQAKKEYEKQIKHKGADVYAKTMRAYHAFVYEIISHMDFPNRDANNRTVHLFRTEDDQVMQMNKLKPGMDGVVIKRGAAESTSIFRPVSVHGSELTEQDVPWHRVLGVYFAERSPGANHGPFLGDNENEFLALLKDIPFYYVK